MTTNTTSTMTALAQALTDALTTHESKAFEGGTLKFRSALRDATGQILNKAGRPYSKPEKGLDGKVVKRDDSESQADWVKPIKPADLNDAQLCDLFVYGVGRRLNDYANSSFTKLDNKSSDGIWEHFLANILGQETKRGGPAGPRELSPEAQGVQDFLNTEDDKKRPTRKADIRALFEACKVKTGGWKSADDVLAGYLKAYSNRPPEAVTKAFNANLRAEINKAIEKAKARALAGKARAGEIQVTDDSDLIM